MPILGKLWLILASMNFKNSTTWLARRLKLSGAPDALLTQVPHTHWSKYLLNHCIPLLLLSWGQVGCQMKRKSTRNSIFLVSAANFQLELNNLQKRPKYVSKCHFWEGFSKFIQLWLKISGSNPKTQVPWSFSLHLTPCLTPGAQK